MKHWYQLVLKLAGGVPHALVVVAERETEAREMGAAVGTVCHCKELGGWLNPSQAGYNMEEAAVYCGIGRRTLFDWIAQEVLTKPADGRAQYPERYLDQVLATKSGCDKEKWSPMTRRAA